MSRNPSAPIGVFDSGVGGLTVVRALMERLPLESIVYFGDTARVPYGIKSIPTIEHYTAQITDFLLGEGVKMMIIACNTMAAVAAPIVKARAGTIPVLDVIDAGARAAVDGSGSRAIGVIATSTTINSNAYARRMHALDGAVRVFSQACPLLVPLVEEGWLEHRVTRLTVEEYLRPVLAEGVDSLVLGCTHYPLIKPMLQSVAGAGVRLVDSALTTAQAAAECLSREGIANGGETPPGYRFVVTDIPLRFQTIAERFLGRSLGSIEKIDW